MNNNIFYKKTIILPSIEEYPWKYIEILEPISTALLKILDMKNIWVSSVLTNDEAKAIMYIIWQMILNSIEAESNKVEIELRQNKKNIIIRIKDNWKWLMADNTKEKNIKNTLYPNQWEWINTFKMYAYWTEDIERKKWRFKMIRTKEKWTSSVVNINIDNLGMFILNLFKNK